jgi:hypothetical protein
MFSDWSAERVAHETALIQHVTRSGVSGGSSRYALADRTRPWCDDDRPDVTERVRFVAGGSRVGARLNLDPMRLQSSPGLTEEK